MKLQSYAQMTVNRRTNKKLSYKFFEPFLILQRIGQVAYKFQLPDTSRIHPVVHVSQLKKAIPPDTVVSSYEDLNCVTAVTTLVPAQVLDISLHKVGNKAVPYGPVKWDSLPTKRVTWENLHLLHGDFPAMSATV